MSEYSLKQVSIYNHPARDNVIASCSSDKTIQLFNYTTVQKLASIETSHTKTIRSLAFHPSGSKLATASFDGTVEIYSKTRDQVDEDWAWSCTSTLEGHESEVKDVAWSSDGSLLATCGRDKSVWVWASSQSYAHGGYGSTDDAEDWDCLAVLLDHASDVKCVAFHPQHELIASGSYDEHVHLYLGQAEDDEISMVQKLTTDASSIWDLAFNPDGSFLAAVTDNGNIKIFFRRPRKVSEGSWQQREEVWDAVCTHKAFDHSIYSVDWRNDMLVTAGQDAQIKLWQIKQADPLPNSRLPVIQLELLLVQDAADDEINCVRFCNDITLASCSDDGTVRIWQIDTEPKHE